MKTTPSLTSVIFSAVVFAAGAASAAGFGEDVAFLKKNTDVIALRDKAGSAQVALVPAWQGRVMTSAAGGDSVTSFGWINHKLIASRKIQPHINVFGGGDRFWIGIGGHVNDTDENLLHFDQSAYHKAVKLEISEELRLGGGFRERAVALINDDSSEVGRVHLGVVHLVELENDNVSAGEKAIAELGFATREELLERRDTFETLSQILLDGLPFLLKA
jgi:hypothetical protein